LKPFASDPTVQSAFLNVLENDEDAGIRRQAIDALKVLPKTIPLRNLFSKSPKMRIIP
jgi:hypothetical protein